MEELVKYKSEPTPNEKKSASSLFWDVLSNTIFESDCLRVENGLDVEFFTEKSGEIKNGKILTNLESGANTKVTNDDEEFFIEKPKNPVQSEETLNGKNPTKLEEFWAEFDKSETPNGNGKNGNDAEEWAEWEVVQLENNTAEIVTCVSAWLD